MKYNLFLDFDDCIVNSSKAYCDAYDMRYKHVAGYKPANYLNNKRWDFGEECPLAIDRIDDMFASFEFFHVLEFMPDAYEVLEELNEKYKIIIASVGTYGNISRKSLFIKEKLPFIKNSVLLVNDGVKMDKGIVNMNVNNKYESIFIDDVYSNLKTSNANSKICFGEIKDWNIKWQDARCKNWKEIARKLL